VAVETPAPSPFSHEILNANPYAFLDDAPLEERRARAVELRRTLPPDLAGEVGALDPAAIDEVARESWPVVRDADELHDALLTLVWVPKDQSPAWEAYLPTLRESGRAQELTVSNEGREVRGWVATENQIRVRSLFEGGDEEALDTVILGWMESTGPTTAGELAQRLYLPSEAVHHSLIRLEGTGHVLRGQFRSIPHSTLRFQHSGARAPVEWCHRRLLARIHRLTIGRLRKEVEPVTAAEFMRFLLRWQHVLPGARRHGEAGLFEVIRQLAGFEAAASAWDSQLLRMRMARYEPELLDRLCLAGAVSWGRLSLHPRLTESPDGERVRRITPTSVAPISVFPREDGEWLLDALEGEAAPMRPEPFASLSGVAQALRRTLADRGACFFADLVRLTNHLPSEVEEGLWELVAAGLATADGFDNLRALMDPHRRRAEGRERSRRPRHAAGRWSLLRTGAGSSEAGAGPAPGDRPSTRCLGKSNGRQEAGQSPAEQVARLLLRRYGVVFRDLLARESLVSSWRDLLVAYRRMELKGEVRGGRFVSGFTGEQFALPEAVEALRTARKNGSAAVSSEVKLSACDPLNLAGIILPGSRVPAVPTNFLILKDGQVARAVLGRERHDRSMAQVSVAEAWTARLE
jgi:ATP-dependent Lhr-like helicase